MSSLMQIQKEYKDLELEMDTILESTEGEITPQLEALELRLKDQLLKQKAKVDSIAFFIDSIKAQVEVKKEWIKEARANVKISENRVEYLEHVIRKTAGALGGLLVGNEVQFNLAPKQASVEIIDEKLIPFEYLREKITMEPDKALIKTAMENGTNVPGVELVKTMKRKAVAK